MGDFGLARPGTIFTNAVLGFKTKLINIDGVIHMQYPPSPSQISQTPDSTWLSVFTCESPYVLLGKVSDDSSQILTDSITITYNGWAKSSKLFHIELGKLMVEDPIMKLFIPDTALNSPIGHICRIFCDPFTNSVPSPLEDPLAQSCGSCYVEGYPKRYFDQLRNRCAECDVSCFTCDGPSKNHCLSCPPQNRIPKGAVELTQKDGMCVIICNQHGWYHHVDEEICSECHKSCFKCDGGTAQECRPLGCNAGYQWNPSISLCTEVCSEGKYYDIDMQKCMACPFLEECSRCGPGRKDCPDEDSCNEGFEWDPKKAFTCKVKINAAALEELGLNPDKQYFELEETEAEVEEPVDQVSGDQKNYKEGDMLTFAVEKTITYDAGLKLKFRSDCLVSYKNPVTKKMRELDQKADDELTLPADVEITFPPECAITFLNDVNTIEREQQEGLEKEVIIVEEPILYLQGDTLEFLDAQTELVFKVET
jgi:hypothetical protein